MFARNTTRVLNLTKPRTPNAALRIRPQALKFGPSSRAASTLSSQAPVNAHAQASSRGLLSACVVAITCVVYVNVLATHQAGALCEASVNEAEALYDSGNGDKEKTHAYLVEYIKNNPTDADALWRYARACHDMATVTADKEKKKAYVYEAHEVAKQALELAPTNFACHKWYAITLSSIGDYEGTKSTIENAFPVRKHFEKALELSPGDATTSHLLGLWHYTIADMSWYVRKIAATIFASPPESTYEAARDCFAQAEASEPGFYLKNALMLGKAYAAIGDSAQAKIWFEKAKNMPVGNADDKEAQAEAAKLC